MAMTINGDSVVLSVSLVLETSMDIYVRAWWFETEITGAEWDAVLFTKILNDCMVGQSYSRHPASPAFSHIHVENTVLSLFLALPAG